MQPCFLFSFDEGVEGDIYDLGLQILKSWVMKSCTGIHATEQVLDRSLPKEMTNSIYGYLMIH